MTHSEQVRVLRRLLEAEGYLELRLPVQAVEVLQRLGGGGPFDYQCRLLRGLALRDLGRYADALADLEAAAREKPDNPTLCLAIGWCLKRTGQLPRAIAALQRAQRAHPDDALLQYNLACYYSLACQKESAIGWLRRALHSAPQMRQLIPEEHDFDSLRGDRDFEEIAGDAFIA